MQLTPHFTLEEFTRSAKAQELGIDNTPNAEQVENLKHLAAALEKVRAIVGIPLSISSGYRCDELNSEVGGESNSAHKEGNAADIKAAGLSPYALALFIVQHNIKFDQLILEPGWVHFGLFSGKRPQRGQIMTKKKGGGYISGLHK